MCSAQIWSHTCGKIAPIKYQDVLLFEDKNDGHDNIYLPSVLTDNKKKTNTSNSLSQA